MQGRERRQEQIKWEASDNCCNKYGDEEDWRGRCLCFIKVLAGSITNSIVRELYFMNARISLVTLECRTCQYSRSSGQGIRVAGRI